MSTLAYWNEIVSEYNDNLNCKEEIVQKTWEVLFKLCFGYSKSEIDSQRSVKMGVMTKRADIVITNGAEDLFVVELKRHVLHEGQEQLFSYLNQLKMDLGILICDKLYIYDYDYTAKENAYSVLEIPFVQDNPNGSRFVELFSKDNFDKQKIKDFIRESNAAKNAISEIKSELTSSLAVELLKEHFTKKYPEVDFEKIIAEYNVSVSLKSAIPSYNSSSIPAAITSFVPKNMPASFGSKDATQFMVNGTPSGGKGPTVYAAVKAYIASHPNISVQELKSAFPDYLAKPGFGKMIRSIEEVTPNEWSGSRFSKHPITLSDGTRITVSTQWKPDNMHSFIEGAKRLGIEVVPIS